MDEDFQQLEAELKRLRPIAPSADVQARVARDLALAPRRRAQILRFWWVALPIAASVALILAFGPSLRRPEDRPPPKTLTATKQPAPAFKPVAARNILVDSRDEGLVTLADGTPARRLRQSYVDTITWKNSRTNASLKWSVPREEVSVVPVSYQ